MLIHGCSTPPCPLELVTADADGEVVDALLDVVDAVVVAAVAELEVDAADEVKLVDAGAADEPDDEETEAELDVVWLTTAVAAQEQTAAAEACTTNAEFPHAERTQVIAAA